jgi:hypothetical protein
MSKKFILIDNSIKGFGGHHYEYAMHVLQAAHDEGFETVLATNKKFKDDVSVDIPWKVVPVYDLEFWSSPPKKVVLRDLLREKLINLKNKLRFSKLGYKFQLLRELNGSNIKMYLKNFNIIELIIYLFFLFVYKYSKILFINVKNIIKNIFVPVFKLIKPLKEYFLTLYRSFKYLIEGILWPVLILKNKTPIIRKYLDKQKRINTFAKNTDKLLKEINCESSDIVFIPTLSELDMLGLLKTFKNIDKNKVLNWHLLFRRNIFIGKSDNYKDQDTSEIKSYFTQFNEENKTQNVKFWTDTDRLTTQYNLLNTCTFFTLPIPINPDFTDVKEEFNYPLNIVYSGDARREKGYAFIQDIVQSLMKDYIETGKVKFELQSNFAFANPSDGTKEYLARYELDTYDNKYVKLYKEPLSSDEYLKLVSSADILLNLYDADNYFARSSGILVEGLAGAIPMLSTQGSWMAQELCDYNYSHLEDLIKSQSVINKINTKELKLFNTFSNKKLNSEEIKFGIEKIYSNVKITLENINFLLFEIDTTIANDYHIEFSYALVKDGKDISSKNIQLAPSKNNTKRLVAIAIIEEFDSLYFELRNSYSNENIYIKGLNIYCLNSLEKLHNEVLCKTTDLSIEEIVENLKQIIDNYETYKKASIEFSEEWNKKHNAKKVIWELSK